MERFWNKVDKTEDCWIWTATKTQGGYGRLRVDGQFWVAHRYAYEMMVGPIPEGLVLDHLCKVRHCVNPGHLQAVTHTENVRRGNGGRPVGSGTPKSGRPRRPDGSFVSCPKGHEYSGTNLYIRKDGSQDCRRCSADRHAWNKGV